MIETLLRYIETQAKSIAGIDQSFVAPYDNATRPKRPDAPFIEVMTTGPRSWLRIDHDLTIQYPLQILYAHSLTNLHAGNANTAEYELLSLQYERAVSQWLAVDGTLGGNALLIGDGQSLFQSDFDYMMHETTTYLCTTIDLVVRQQFPRT